MKEILRENKEAVSDAGLAVQQVVGEMVGQPEAGIVPGGLVFRARIAQPDDKTYW